MKFPLIGNNKINVAISNALKEHRIPHAILIEGDVGTGRHTLTEFLCKAAVCSGEDIPCNSCSCCRLADSKSHPDITVISPEDGKKNISVAQIRTLRSEAFVKPHMAKKRVFVIDFADTLNEQSQNALLKILEEPPEAVMFILIAESKTSLLDTVISRCTVLTLSAPDKEQALQFLSNRFDFAPYDIEIALENTQNNIGNALRILNRLCDSETRLAADEFIDCMLRQDVFGMLRITAPFEKSRIEAEAFLKDLKMSVSGALRKKYNTISGRCLSVFYERLSELENNLVTNINLALFFCAVVTEANECMKK